MIETPALFLCTRQNMRLTTRGCATLWRSTVKAEPKSWEGRFACMNCPVGRENAGLPPVVTAAGLSDWRNVCARCWSRSDRLILGRYCPSCYNRQREAQLGRNGKGTRPRLIRRLHWQGLTVSVGGTIWRVREDAVVSAAEAVVLAGRTVAGKQATAGIAFGPPAIIWPRTSQQLELAL